jgi:hypothetical protein
MSEEAKRVPVTYRLAPEHIKHVKINVLERKEPGKRFTDSDYVDELIAKDMAKEKEV